MDQVLYVVIGIIIVFCLGYDFSSYMIMKRVDLMYKTRNKWFVGYNTYKVWKTSRANTKD